MENKIILIIGWLLILFGLVLALNSFHMLPLEKSWPLMLILLGIGFLLAYKASPGSYSLLMPAAILIVVSIPLLICSLTGKWQKMAALWPIIQLGPAIGFFAMYFAGPRDRGLLAPAAILALTSLIMLFVSNYMAIFWPLIFILIGIVLILVNLGKKKAGSERSKEDAEIKQPE